MFNEGHLYASSAYPEYAHRGCVTYAVGAKPAALAYCEYFPMVERLAWHYYYAPSECATAHQHN